MEFAYKRGQRLIIELFNNQIWEGDCEKCGNDRIDMLNNVQYPKGHTLKESLSFYRCEIASVRIVGQENDGEEVTSTQQPEAERQENPVSLCNISLIRSQYQRLKDMSLNYIYMATMDKRYIDAITDLNNCENVGVHGVGSQFGRHKAISLLVLSSWNQVYIFDLLLYKKAFPQDLKTILEMEEIKKVIHDSGTLVDCLWHRYGVTIDSKVADIAVEKKQTGCASQKTRNLSECLARYFNFPTTFLEPATEVSLKEWEERPLNDSQKIKAALLVTYLITLKNKLEGLLLQEYYAAVKMYSRKLLDLNGYAMQKCLENTTDAEELLHGIATTFVVVIILLLVINFLSQYIPVFRYDYTAIRRKDVQFNKQLLFSEIRNSNNENNLVTDQHQHQSSDEYQIKQPKCEVIHIGVVCSGYKANLYFHTMLKSIYFYRNNPLHFHIMVNKLSEKVLKALFETWAVPQVSVTFYNVNNSVSDVRWVPNTHYSGIYGLLKLVFPKVIPLNVTDRIIVIDIDLTFVGDIYELWNLFESFNRKQVIGVVENQSDYYLGKLYSVPWPALGRGFNTGVILYQLEHLKTIGWDKLWARVAKKTASLFGATRLADQDIINAVIKQNPDLLYRVPCQWNTQLSDHTHSYNCYNTNQIKVIHWNSPKKFNVINKDGDYFRTLYTTFLELNGNLLRRQLFDCENSPKNTTEVLVDVCSEFRKAQSRQWRTLLFFREFKYVPTKDDVTFVAQLSYDRLQMIEELCKYWDGPVSLTFYVTDPELQQCIHFIENSEVLQDRLDIAYHAVFKEGDYHPINELRNVGLGHVVTPYVFLADADFLPMHSLYPVLKNYIESFKSMNRKALVVPAFETQRYRSHIPKNKRELLQMLDNKSVFTFRYDVWPVGHAPVNYQKWRTAQVPYKVKWQSDFEPYIIVSRNVTEYDRRFLGFGWNKVSHIMELEAQGYEFIVLPNAFIIHKPHAPSYDIGKFRNSPIYRMCLQNLKEEFVEKLNRQYGRRFDNRNSSLALAST